MSWIAVGVGAATMVGGSIMGADAASRAAGAQGRAARDWASQSRQQVNQAYADYGSYAPSQQAQIDKAIASQTQNIQRQQRLVDSIDPALLEAGKQMTSLLQGQSAPVLNNIQNQRDMQKKKMLDGLRQQMGPGAETSSMGQNMLMKFDAETANIMSAAQQQYLDKVSNLAIGGGQTLTSVMGNASKELASLGDQLGQIGMNYANIKLGGIAAQNPAEQAVINAAGGEFKGQQLIGQGLMQAGSGIATAGLMSAVGGGKQAKPGTLGEAVTPDPNSAEGVAAWMKNPNTGVQDYYASANPGNLGGAMSSGGSVGGGGGQNFYSPGYPTQGVGPMKTGFNSGATGGAANYIGDIFGNNSTRTVGGYGN